jgi:hypothetical protein
MDIVYVLDANYSTCAKGQVVDTGSTVVDALREADVDIDGKVVYIARLCINRNEVLGNGAIIVVADSPEPVIGEHSAG